MKPRTILHIAILTLAGFFSLNAQETIGQDVLDLINRTAHLDNPVLEQLTYSSGAAGSHPVENMLDGDENSYYSLEGSSGSARITLNFQNSFFLEGFTLKGWIPQGSLLYLETEIDEELISIPSGYIIHSGTDFYLDLSKYKQLSDNLTLNIKTPDIENFLINEIEIQAVDSDRDLSKKQLIPYRLFYSRSRINNDFLLTDGRIGTVWHNQYRGYGPLMNWQDNFNRRGREQSSYDQVYQEEIRFLVPRSGEMDFLKIYLTEEAQGILTPSVKVQDQWIELSSLNLGTLQGWQKVDLQIAGEITEIKLGLDDATARGRRGNYGGIGEIELWGRTNPEQHQITPIISPARDYPDQSALFYLTEPQDRMGLIVLTLTEPVTEIPDCYINGINLENGQSYSSSDIFYLEYPLDAPLLDEGYNSFLLSDHEENKLLSAQLIYTAEGPLKLSSQLYSDGFRYSGNETTETDPLLLELLEGQADIDEIILYYTEQAPSELYLLNEGIESYPDIYTQWDEARLYTEEQTAEALGFMSPGSLQEAEVYGSPNQIVNPYIRILFPTDGQVLPAQIANQYKVIGVTDYPDGIVEVNGIKATVQDNFFWVEINSMDMRSPGEHSIVASVEMANGNRAEHTINLFLQSQQYKIRLTQSDQLYSTFSESFLLSGSVTGPARDLRIEGRNVELGRGKRFEHEVSLNTGLNLLSIELYDGDTLVARELRQVYRRRQDTGLTINAPMDGSLTSIDSVDVQGFVFPLNLEKIEVNRISAELKGSTYLCRDIPLVYGENEITVEASYLDGSRLTRRVRVYLDQEGPDLWGILPEDGSIIGKDEVMITGSVEYESGTSLFINGKAVELSGERFSAMTPLPVEELNPINISARDAAGNRTNWPEFYIYRDLTGPEPFEIRVEPWGITNDRRPVIYFETTDKGIGLDHYELSIEDQPFYEQSSPCRLPYLDHGTTSITLRAFDQLGNYTDSSINIHIDTETPDMRQQAIKIIPGNDRCIIEWTEDEDDIDYYRISLEETGTEHTLDYEVGKNQYQYILENLESNTPYRLKLYAADQAGNIGEPLLLNFYTNMVESALEESGYTEIEYDGVELTIPPGSLDGEIDNIIIRELENSPSADDSIFPLLSPVYSFSVAHDEGVQEHIEFDKPFAATIEYNELLLNSSIPEHLLGVYYYDEDWGQWFLTEENFVDTENNRICFASDHFSEYTVQPTSAETVDYRQWKGTDFPLTSQSTNHSFMSVSPQGGSMSTAMTEFVLPGLNGLDLVLRRTYSSTTADSDSRLTPLSTYLQTQQIYGHDNGTSDPEALFEQFLEENEDVAETWAESCARDAILKRAEMTYSLGQGWRLDLPYIRFSDKEVMINIPGQGFLFTKDMKRNDYENNGNITYTDVLNGTATVTLLKSQISPDRFSLDNIRVSTADGKVYLFTDTGLIESISDIYDNTIRFEYEGLKLSRIRDSLGRSVFFQYYLEEETEGSDYIPLIVGIAAFDKDSPFSAPTLESSKNPTVEEMENAQFYVNYTYNLDIEHTGGIPLLKEARDIQGRIFNYEYQNIYLQLEYPDRGNDYYPRNTQTRYIFPLSSINGPGVGKEKVVYGENLVMGSNDLEGYSTLVQTYDYKNVNADIKACALALSVDYIETYSDENPETDPVKTTDYQYTMDDEGQIKQSIVDNGRLREVYNYSSKRYFLEYIVTRTIGAYGEKGKMISGTLKEIVSEEVETRLETSYISSIYQDGNLVPLIEKTTGYSDSMQRPSKVTTRLASQFNNQYIEELYSYDSWGNVIMKTHSEYNDDYTTSRTTWNWYEDSPSLPSGYSFSDYPDSMKSEYSGANIPDRIHNRIIRSYSTWDSNQEGIPSEKYDIQRLYEYDDKGSLVYSAERAGDLWAVEQYTYNARGEISSYINALQHKVEYKYSYDDSRGEMLYRKVSVSEMVPVWDADVDADADADVDVDEYTLQEKRETHFYNHPLGGWTLIEKRPDGKEITRERDNLGRVTLLTLPKEESEDANPTIRITYDDTNMTVTQYDPLNNYQVYSFNNRGEITQITHYENNGSELNRTQITQDYYGNVSRVISPEQNTLEYEYDGYGRITKESIYDQYIDSNGSINYGDLSRTYQYSPEIHATTITDEAGRVSIQYLDAANRVIKEDQCSPSGDIYRTRSIRYNGRGEKVWENDFMGNETSYIYDQRGNLVQTTLPRATYHINGEESTGSLTSTNIYNALGLLVEESLNSPINELISSKNYIYDSLGRLTMESLNYDGYALNEDKTLNEDKISKPAEIYHFYDILDREVAMMDPMRDFTTREFSLRGQVVSEINGLDGETTYTYDLKDRMLSMTDPRENSNNYTDFDGTILYDYDELDRLTHAFLPLGAEEEIRREITFGYDREGNLLYRKEPDGSVTRYVYNHRNQVTREIRQDAVHTTEVTKSYTTHYYYDKAGQLIKQLSPGLNYRLFEYDPYGRMIEETLQEGGTNRYSYDLNDNMTASENGRGYIERYQYDSLNRLINRTDRENESWESGYDYMGNISYTYDPNNITRIMEYDQRGSLIREEDGRMLSAYYGYDEAGNLDWALDRRETLIEYTYNAINLPTSVTYSSDGTLNHNLTYEYDEAGGLKKAVDGSIETLYNQYNNQYVPDPMGQVTRQTITNYSTVTYSYDLMNRLSSIKNGSYDAVNYQYDSLGRLSSIDGYINSVNYNNEGLMSGYSMNNGVSVDRVYDRNNRLSALSYTLLSGQETESTLKSYNYSYDNADNLIQENSNRFSYDGRNMLSLAVLTDDVVGADDVSMDYSQVETRSVTNDVIGMLEVPLGTTEDFKLDWGSRSLTADLGYSYLVSKIDLHVQGTLSTEQQQRLNADTIALFYARDNRENQYAAVDVKSLEIKENDEGNTDIFITFNRAVVGRFIKIHTHYNQRDLQYAADSGSAKIQLISTTPFTVYQQVGGGRNEFYSYDAKGNRQKRFLNEGSPIINNYSYYSGTDWLKTDGTYAYQYDDNGNLRTKGTEYSISVSDPDEVSITQSGTYWSYSYDLRNRMTEVKKWDGSALNLVASYTYDINGYRIQKTDENNHVTKYVFDLWGNMIEEIEIGAAVDESNKSTGYVFMGGTHIAQINDNGDIFYFGTNHLGSTTLVTDEDGGIIENMTGETTPFGDQENKNIFFTGKMWDEDAELYYFNARWYDPETGRFVTEDPIKDGLLWYGYVNNNPMGFVDPTGMINLNFSIQFDMHNPQWGTANQGESNSVQIKKQGCYLTGFAMATATLLNDGSFFNQFFINPMTINGEKDNFVDGSSDFSPRVAAENYGLKYDYWTRANNTTDGKQDLAGKINELNKSDTEYSILAHVAWDPANPDTATHWVGISGAAIKKEGEEGFGDGYYVQVTGTSKFDNPESRPDYWVTDAEGNYWIPTDKIPDINTFEKNENNVEEGEE